MKTPVFGLDFIGEPTFEGQKCRNLYSVFNPIIFQMFDAKEW